MKRVKQLIPISRFHKRVLFIGESCKTDGARFSGYPTDVKGRETLLLQFKGELELHLNVLNRMIAAALQPEALKKTVASRVLLEIENVQVLMEAISLDGGKEESLNDFGLALVSLVRSLEREAFQEIQQKANEECLDRIFQIAKQAEIYQFHSL